jgi:hypothetical protein
MFVRKSAFLLVMLACFGTFSVSAQSDQCESLFETCSAQAEDYLTACENRCTSLSGDVYSSCIDRCDDRASGKTDACEEKKMSCAEPKSARASATSVDLPDKPSFAQGNGCYLGECPSDEPEPSVPAPKENTPTPQPDPRVPQNTAYPPAIQYSWMCQTPMHWCTVTNSPQPLPVGSPCWCNNPYLGYANGIMIPQQ